MAMDDRAGLCMEDHGMTKHDHGMALALPGTTMALPCMTMVHYGCIMRTMVLP